MDGRIVTSRLAAFPALFLAGLVLLGLVACGGETRPPEGKWEGAAFTQGVMVTARVEIQPDGLVRISAPDITGMEEASTAQIERMRARLAAELVTNWDEVAPRPFDFDGTTFRKPGGVAPQMVWDKASNQMTLQFYFGNNQALPVTLRPVDNFHDNPWPAG